MTKSSRQFVRFCAVGALGFAIDSSLTLILVSQAEASPLVARACAFFAGASATWLLNRSFTFRTAGGVGRWLLYLGLTGLGGLLNVGVYVVWVSRFGSSPWQLLLGIFWGACCALAFNFAVSKYIVFVPRGAKTRV